MTVPRPLRPRFLNTGASTDASPGAAGGASAGIVPMCLSKHDAFATMAAAQADAEEGVRAQFLEHNVRIRLRETPRAFLGVLVCVDRHGNAILDQVTEQTLDASTAEEPVQSERAMPMVMIPGATIGRVEVQTRPAPTPPASTSMYL